MDLDIFGKLQSRVYEIQSRIGCPPFSFPMLGPKFRQYMVYTTLNIRVYCLIVSNTLEINNVIFILLLTVNEYCVKM